MSIKSSHTPSIAISLVFILLTIVTSRALGFEISYHYELIQGKRLPMCQHMLETYNTLFIRPWSSEGERRRNSEPKASGETLYALHPSSPEFDAIQWKVHSYLVGKNQHSALYSEFDIDNDGVNDFVLWVGFFDGSPGSWDYISVFPLGAVDLSDFRTHSDFLEHIVPKRKAVLGYPVHERPFIYKGRTYIHGYTFTPRKFAGGDAAEPFAPPEYTSITEYLGGPANDAEVQRRNRSMKPVCKFNMIQQS